jgi:hypothetical protein
MLSTALITWYGWRDHLHFADESIAVIGGRYVEGHLPSGLWDTTYFPRGPERLTSWAAAAVNLVMPTTAGEFQALHLVLALAFALTAIPIYFLSRGVGLGPLSALVPSAVTVLGPWAMYGVTLLNNGFGLLSVACLYLAMWRCLARRGARSDLWLLAALGFVALARMGNVTLVLALPVAVLVQVWRDRPAGQRARSWLEGLPKELLRRHPVLLPCAALAVATVIVAGPDAFLGGKGYGGVRLGQHIDLAGVWERTHITVARGALATAIIPAIFALPWLVREAAVPRTRDDGAFAVLALIVFAILIYTYYGSFDEDRYFIPVIPLIAVAFGRALFSRSLGVIATAMGAVIVGWFIAITPAPSSDLGLRTIFFAPAYRFLHEVVRGQLSVHLPLGSQHPLTVALCAGGLLAVLLAARDRLGRRVGAIVLGAALAGIAVYQIGAEVWSMRKFTADMTGAGISWAQTTFVDRADEPGPVHQLTNNYAQDPYFGIPYIDLAFFNRRAWEARPLTLSRSLGSAVPGKVRIDPRTGAAKPDRLAGRLLVSPLGYAATRLAADGTVTSPIAPVRLDTLHVPLHASFSITGTGPGGWGEPGQTMTIRTFAWPGRATPACLTATVEGPLLGDKEVRYTVRGAEDTASGHLPPSGADPLSVRLGSGDEVVRVSTEGAGRLSDGRTTITVRLTNVDVRACP